MSRWIDADEIEPIILWQDYEGYVTAYSDAEIENAPSIDIVRCRECKKRDDDYVCYKWASVDECPQVRPDDFCSYGNRSEKPNNSKERSSE